MTVTTQGDVVSYDDGTAVKATAEGIFILGGPAGSSAISIQIMGTGSSTGIGGAATNTDGITAGSAAQNLRVFGFNSVFNRTSWDRQRGDTNGTWVTPPPDYETVAASQTAQVLGATGAAGDYINGVLVVPATTSPGAVTLLDNATSITICTGGTVVDVKPFWIPLGMKSVSGAWKLTTGSNVSCIAMGRFT